MTLSWLARTPDVQLRGTDATATSPDARFKLEGIRLDDPLCERLLEADWLFADGRGAEADAALKAFRRGASRQKGWDAARADALVARVRDFALSRARLQTLDGVEAPRGADATDRLLHRLALVGLPKSELLDLPSDAWEPLADMDAALQMGSAPTYQAARLGLKASLTRNEPKGWRRLRKRVAFTTQGLDQDKGKYRLFDSVLRGHHAAQRTLPTKLSMSPADNARVDLARMLRGDNADAKNEWVDDAWQRHAIHKYTTAWYGDFVRTLTQMRDVDVVAWRDKILALDKGLRNRALDLKTKSTTKSGDTSTVDTLFRRTRIYDASRFQPGTFTSFRQMSSTSTSQSESNKFRGLKFQIKPLGHDVSAARDIEGISLVPEEKELLYRPGAVFKTVKTDQGITHLVEQASVTLADVRANLERRRQSNVKAKV